MGTQLNPLSACIGVLTQPKATFFVLKKQHNWSWLAFLLVMVAAILPMYYYFHVVDFQWYKESIIASQFSNVSPSEQQSARGLLEATQGIIGTVITPFIMMLTLVSIIAGYLNITTKIDPQNINSYGDWFGFSWWVLMPSCVGALLSLGILFFATDGQISFDAISPSALSFIFAIPPTSSWFGLASSIKLETFWTMYLIFIGLSQWVELSRQRAIIIAFTPCLVIWLSWALLLLI